MSVITITLLAGAVENEVADFTVRFAHEALSQGHRVNLFLIGNGCNLANKEIAWTGERGMSNELTAFMDGFRLADRLEGLPAKGAVIHTCHTTEYGRGTEGCDYLDGVIRGNVGVSLTKFLITSDLAFTV